MEINMEKILETPDKQFQKLYDEMKAYYTPESAKKLKDFYSKQSLDFIVSHFLEIAKESFEGTDFIHTFLYNYSALFPDCIRTLEFDFRGYVDDNIEKIPARQYEKYKMILEAFTSLHKTPKSFWYIRYTEGDEKYQKVFMDIRKSISVSDNLYKKASIIVNTIVDNYYTSWHCDEKKCDYDRLVLAVLLQSFLYCKPDDADEDGVCSKALNLVKDILCEADLVDDSREETASLIKRLVGNSYEAEAPFRRFADESLLKLIYAYQKYSEIDKEKSLTTKVCNENVTHGNRFNAVVDLLIESEDDSMNEDYANEKSYIEDTLQNLYLTNLKILTEAYVSDAPFDSSEYSMIDNTISSYEEAFAYLNKKTSNAFFEAGEDAANDAVEKIDSVSKHNKPNESMTKKIQHKAMDVEAEQNKKHAKRKEAAENLAGAAKAISNIPKSFTNDVKDLISKVEEKDVERRKKFMSKPGFRKHVFKTLKLAILYGSVANVKLALVPVTALIRHYSKEKDVRVRNELVKELETEIKVTEEKINDASTNGDQDAKYKLIRIKEKLEQEKERVKYNSKFI